MSKIVQTYQIVVGCGQVWLIVVDCGRLWLIVHNCAQLCNLVPAIFFPKIADFNRMGVLSEFLGTYSRFLAHKEYLGSKIKITKKKWKWEPGH